MKNALWSNLFKGWNRVESKTVLTLKQVPIFKDFSNREFKALEQLIHLRSYKPGEYIFKNNAPGEGMYIILSGQVEIVIGEKTKDKKVLAKLKKGDFFGELALLDAEPRSASGIALKHSELLGFFRPDLFSLLERNPTLGNRILLNLASVIGERLRTTNKLLIQAQTKI
ncbi:MAG: cyclic nucleotide-binding domain-containing protein [Candidatus Neomarinimicrobiota bacterium]